MKDTFSLDPDIAKRLRDRYTPILNETRNQTGQEGNEFLPSQVPSIENIQALIEAAFWASLKKEEGRHHKFSLTFSPHKKEYAPFVFESPMGFDHEQLAKLAPALQNQGAHIGVCQDENNGLVIWGFTLSTSWSFVIEAYDAGQLLTSFCNSEKALITGSRMEFIDPTKFSLIRNLLTGMSANWESKYEFTKAVLGAMTRESDFKEIAKSMLSHGHGGALLVVPTNEAWKPSIDLVYGGNPYEKVKSDFERRDEARKQEPRGLHPPSWQLTVADDSLSQSLKMIGHLTAVDGATLVNYDLAVLGFGAKIKPINPDNKPKVVLVSEPFEGSEQSEMEISDLLWGTRHQSAAQFVYDQKEALALVASQDGRLSAFAWDPEKKMVSVISHAESALF